MQSASKWPAGPIVHPRPVPIMWLWLLELPVENGYSVCFNIWEGVCQCCSWHKTDALGITAVYTQWFSVGYTDPDCCFILTSPACLPFLSQCLCCFVFLPFSCMHMCGACVCLPNVCGPCVQVYISSTIILLPYLLRQGLSVKAGTLPYA